MSASNNATFKTQFEARNNYAFSLFFGPVRPNGFANPDGVFPFSATQVVEATSLRGPGQQHLCKTDATRVVGHVQNRLLKG